jgi:hypothetical protein
VVRRADLVVKAIMVGLCFASLLTWTIFIAQFLEMIQQRTRPRRLRPYDELLFRWQRRGEWRRSHSGQKINALSDNGVVETCSLFPICRNGAIANSRTDQAVKPGGSRKRSSPHDLGRTNVWPRRRRWISGTNQPVRSRHRPWA